jgi:hypothetical protein
VHVFNELEQLGLAWIAELCGVPSSHRGVVSSGGSTANLIALGTARQWAFEQRGKDVARDGLPTGVQGRVYASHQAHHTIQRSAAVVGLGRQGTRHIQCDVRQRIDIGALRTAMDEDSRAGIVPVAVVGVAGTTDTGAVDPLQNLAESSRERGAWFHVDGAYGLAAFASETLTLCERALTKPCTVHLRVIIQLFRPGRGIRADRPVAHRRVHTVIEGFEDGYTEVNGTRLHYVAGGHGEPLVLLPGWPRTWWQFHKIMPALSERHRVIAVDLRGMGGSDKPAAGYDKKTMARDIYELVRSLGYEEANIAGEDIGSMVAYSFAANYPQATRKVALWEVGHPGAAFNAMTLLPQHGQPSPPFFDLAQICVKPRKSNVSGFPRPRAARFPAALRPNSTSRAFSGCSSNPNLANRPRSSARNRCASC